MAVASDGQGHTVPSTPVSVTVNNSAGNPAQFIKGQTPGAVRNNFGGFVGMKFTVGATALTVDLLGRIYLSGNSGTHTVKLVQASNGVDVPGGPVSLSLAGGGTANTYKYAALASPVTLQANTSYYLLSQDARSRASLHRSVPRLCVTVAVRGTNYREAFGTADTSVDRVCARYPCCWITSKFVDAPTESLSRPH